MLPGVSKTAILTLRARADEHAREDRIFEDPLAAEWFSQVDWPEELDDWYAVDAQESLAFRADDIDQILRRYADAVSKPLTVVELGCGLSTRQDRLSDLSVTRWYDLDLPEVVELRTQWGAKRQGHQHLAKSVLDYSWMDDIDGDPASTFFIAEGLLYYLPRASVDALLSIMRKRFDGAAFVQDVVGSIDYPKLLENTSKLGTPTQWSFERSFDEVLEDFGLEVVEGFDPDRLTADAVDRYWRRFDNKTRFAIYWGMNSKEVKQLRSGVILGRLRSHE